MDYKGKVYAKINGKYIECTETIQQLEDKISKLEEALGKNLPKITEEEINEIMEIVGFPEIEYKTEVHEDEYKGTDLEGFPPEVVECDAIVPAMSSGGLRGRTFKLLEAYERGRLLELLTTPAITYSEC